MAFGDLARRPRFWVPSALLLTGLIALAIQHSSAVRTAASAAVRGVAAHWSVALIVLGAAGLLWLSATTVRDRAERPLRKDVRPLSGVAVTAMIVFTVAVGVVVTLLLFHEADTATAKDPVALRIDAIKTGIAVALGTGGGAVFLIAIRRQWLSERTQAFTEVDQLVRRRNELYAGAIGHLDSNSAPVRLGALETLGLLGFESPEHRDRIIDVVCAYLREPFDHENVASEKRSEVGVRLAAQDVLLRLTSAGRVAPDLDLTGAALKDLSLSGARLGTCVFVNCRFIGKTQLNRTIFEKSADLSGAEFIGSIRLDDARFAESAEFKAKRCTGSFSAVRTNFGDAWFADMKFEGEANFTEATFRKRGWFNNCRFGGAVDFSGITSVQRLQLPRAEVTPNGMNAQHKWPDGWTAIPSADGRTAALTETP